MAAIQLLYFYITLFTESLHACYNEATFFADADKEELKEGGSDYRRHIMIIGPGKRQKPPCQPYLSQRESGYSRKEEEGKSRAESLRGIQALFEPRVAALADMAG